MTTQRYQNPPSWSIAKMPIEKHIQGSITGRSLRHLTKSATRWVQEERIRKEYCLVRQPMGDGPFDQI